MKQPAKFFRRLFDAAQRRFARSRPGSVLILVIALLVLLALIGTAYMTMAQGDRAAAQQHTFNTEVDLLMEGVENMVKGTVVGELFASGQFRPANGYNSWNALGLDTQTINNRKWGPDPTKGIAGVQPGDPWLASRVPEPLDPRTASNGAITPSWRFITAPINGGTMFDSPYWPTGTTTPVQFSFRDSVLPSQSTVQIDGQYQPAFVQTDPLSHQPQNGWWMAADADGDGIADAGYVKLLTLDGITYYAAVRIVDNLAAVNASVAMWPNPNPQPLQRMGTAPKAYILPGDFFPTNIDLKTMIWPQDNQNGSATGIQSLDNYRFGVTALDSAGTTFVPFNDTPQQAAPRTDFQFSTAQEAVWDMLGRRLGYPCPYPRNANGSQYNSLPLGETAAMAYKFCLAPSSPSSLLEQFLPFSTAASTTPYLPTQTSRWYSDNFNYGVNDAFNLMPLRALLVSRNPMSNFSPNKFRFRAVGNNGNPTDGLGAFQFGDFALFQTNKNAKLGTPADMRPFVCIDPSLAAGGPQIPLPFNPPIAPVPTDGTGWVFEPWKDAPTKTNVNTASFEQLWMAYWNVMVEAGINNQQPQPMFPAPGPGFGRMFRSPIRPNTGATSPQLISAGQVAQLRAALAAVNTLDLRDSDDDVTSRTIFLTAGPTTYLAQIYGIEKQPFITEVYARNDSNKANDWLVIELYNPYSTPITLNNWRVAALNRNSVGGMSLADKGTIPLPQGATQKVPTILPGQYLFLTNNTTPPAGVQIPSGLPMAQMSNLTDVLENEFVLLRPRRADGTLTSSSSTLNSYDEHQVEDLVPVDSYDFTNMKAKAAKGQETEWHYIRPFAPGTKDWHCVYPGRWVPSLNTAGAAGKPTVEPTVFKSAPLAMTNLNTLNQTQSASLMPGVYKDVPIQLNNVDFGGPNKPTQMQGNLFPFGAFPRNGDILQVTFIGSYKLYTLPPPNAKTKPRLLEVNPVTMDSTMATASDLRDRADAFQPYLTNRGAAAENIGRFCPIDGQDAAAGSGVDDFFPAPAPGQVPTQWRYRWAMKLFEYLTVECPQDDYLPNVDPGFQDYLRTNNLTTPQFWITPTPAQWTAHPYKYFPALPGGLGLPWPVPNRVTGVMNGQTTNPNGATDETSPINGLVNINTAPWRVLAAVRFLPVTARNFFQNNIAIAQSIVYYRDVNDGKNNRPHGPFSTLFELNDVPIYLFPNTVGSGGTVPFRDVLASLSAQIPDQATYMASDGYLTPVVKTGGPNLTGAPRGDFETRFLMLNRVSNLLTTRSDSFTAYILVQGWRDAETSNPHLVVQRRTTLLIDRSPVTPVNKSADVTRVPSD